MSRQFSAYFRLDHTGLDMRPRQKLSTSTVQLLFSDILYSISLEMHWNETLIRFRPVDAIRKLKIYERLSHEKIRTVIGGTHSDTRYVEAQATEHDISISEIM